MNDFIKELDRRIEWDAKMIGLETMRVVVLRWAVEHRAELAPHLRDQLMRTMQGTIDAAMVERPVVQPIAEESTCSRG